MDIKVTSAECAVSESSGSRGPGRLRPPRGMRHLYRWISTSLSPLIMMWMRFRVRGRRRDSKLSRLPFDGFYRVVIDLGDFLRTTRMVGESLV